MQPRHEDIVLRTAASSSRPQSPSLIRACLRGEPVRIAAAGDERQLLYIAGRRLNLGTHFAEPAMRIPGACEWSGKRSALGARRRFA